MIFTVLAVILLGYVSAFVPSGRPPHPHPHPQHQRLSMHFEESAIGNTALPQEALPAARYVACNRFKVRKNAGPKFEQRWANRKSRLAELEGFRFFSLMKRVGSEEHDYEGEFGNYVSMTVWESKDDFDAWRTGDAFKEAHGGGGLSSFVQLLSTALFVLDGAPKPSFYDALLPVAGEPLSFPSEGGWRSVEADGRNYLPPDLFMGQTRFCVRPGEEVGFERAWKQRQAGVGAGAGAGSFLLRRDATRADDGFNYIACGLFRDTEAGAEGGSGGSGGWGGWGLDREATEAVEAMCVSPPQRAYFEGKLALTSAAGI